MNKLRVINNEDASNIRVGMAPAREKASVAPTPYEKFLTPTLEKDHRSEPSYYSDMTCARTTGTGSESRPGSMDRLVACGRDDQLDSVSMQEGSEIAVTDRESV